MAKRAGGSRVIPRLPGPIGKKAGGWRVSYPTAPRDTMHLDVLASRHMVKLKMISPDGHPGRPACRPICRETSHRE